MEVIRVAGPSRLEGSVSVPGAKNSVLKLMAATLLAVGKSKITNVPEILDVTIMAELLRRLGCDVEHDIHEAAVTIDVPEKLDHKADYELVRAMRASICVLGPLVVRMGAANVALPGGDAIGSRGLDMHAAGLEQMGAEVTTSHGYLIAQAKQGLKATHYTLPFPSVGATENLTMAATLADGVTVLDNVAREPEIVDICSMLVEMGAKIEGIGSPTLTITGVKKLQPVEHHCVPDRIVAGTWGFAAAMTRGDITVKDIVPEHIKPVLVKLEQAGCTIETGQDWYRCSIEHRPLAINVSTMPYPGFATDLQPFVIAMNAVAEGSGIITENVFEARWGFVSELNRLGAIVRLDGHHALVQGIEQLSGAPVEASDIRAGAALVLAGLVADGQTEVGEIHHIDRGYTHFVQNLQNLGAHVDRITKADIFGR
ncbi:MAG: UDP-N-acetylglucosamine 1-carboxyvinyltransferase [Micrococcaceae bacterium]